MNLIHRLRRVAGRARNRLRRDECGFIAISTAAAATLLGALALVAVTMAGSSIATQRAGYLDGSAKQDAEQGLQQLITNLNQSPSTFNPYCSTDAGVLAANSPAGRIGFHAAFDPSTNTAVSTGYAYNAASAAAHPPVSVGAPDAHTGGSHAGVTVKTLNAPLSWRDVYSAATDADGNPTYGVTANGPSLDRACDTAAQAAGRYANHGLWADAVSSDSTLLLSGLAYAASGAFNVATYGNANVNLAGLVPIGVTMLNVTGYGVTPNIATTSGGPSINRRVSQFPAAFDHNLINERIENYDTPSCLATMRPRDGSVLSAGATYCLAGGGALTGSWTAPASGVATVLINGDVDFDGLSIAQPGTGQVHFYVTGNVTFDGYATNFMPGAFVFAPYGQCSAKIVYPRRLVLSGALACHGVKFDSATAQISISWQQPQPDPLVDAALGAGTKTVYFLDRDLDATRSTTTITSAPY
jgi:hypothetical protein